MYSKEKNTAVKKANTTIVKMRQRCKQTLYPPFGHLKS